MTQVLSLEVEKRENVGKGGARATRRAGMVPGIIYGDNKEPVSIRVPQNVLEKEIHAGGFFTHLYDVSVDGSKQRVLAREVQFHPVNELPQHIDFMRVTEKTVINVEIPVHVMDAEQCAALKAGGILNVIRHTVELYVRANNIPESINVNIADMQVGDSLHISEITLPDGAKPVIDDRDFTILQVAAPRVEEEPAEADEDVEGAEGEDGATEASESEDSKEEAGE